MTQSNRHSILLKYFFEKNKVPFPPMENRVVFFSRSSAEIRISQGYTEAEKKIGRAEDIVSRIKEMEQHYKRDCLDQATFKKLKTLLRKKHTPLNSPIENMFGSCTSEILPGVQCPTCLYLSMRYDWRKWSCPRCGTVSKDAYLQGMRDYFLLIKPSITNTELCSFLSLPSPRVAAYLFSLSDLPYTGTNRGRIYHPDKTSIFI